MDHRNVLRHEVAKRRCHKQRRFEAQAQQAAKVLGQPVPEPLLRRLARGDVIPMSDNLHHGLPGRVLAIFDQPNSYGVRPSQLRRMKYQLGAAQAADRMREWHTRGRQANKPHPATEF